jgi:hypothetical protein
VFRAQIIELAMQHDVLDHVMTFVSELPGKIMNNPGVIGAMPN